MSDAPKNQPETSGVSIRRATLTDAAGIAALHRHSLRTALPHLPDLHSPEEDVEFFTGLVRSLDVWLAENEYEMLLGFIAFDEETIQQLYLHPVHQRRGIGSELLRLAMKTFEGKQLRLWTFQANAPARRFYEKHGFTIERLTDGSGNEEKEPDVLYVWRGVPDAGEESATGC